MVMRILLPELTGYSQGSMMRSPELQPVKLSIKLFSLGTQAVKTRRMHRVLYAQPNGVRERTEYDEEEYSRSPIAIINPIFWVTGN
ncbi:hypothetical protein PG993_005842 [Apiospora rasikravindrae]|uniref:Uncharacterized protein n=1 Tax=Apiospora rasikravindrae TaxID=990691 RepID=A0ABR1T9Y3_9PEZI